MTKNYPKEFGAVTPPSNSGVPVPAVLTEAQGEQGESVLAAHDTGATSEAGTYLYAAVQTICKTARARLIRAGAKPVAHIGIRLLATEPNQDGGSLLGERHFERLVADIQPVLTDGGPSRFVFTTPNGHVVAEALTFDDLLPWDGPVPEHVASITRAPSGGLRELLARVAAIEEHRVKRAEEFEGPVNALLATYPELSKKGVQDLAAGLNSILVTAGLAIVCPSYDPNQAIPPGTPCGLRAKPSRNTSTLVLKPKEYKAFKTQETPTLLSMSRLAGRPIASGLLPLKLVSYTSLPGLSKATLDIFRD